MDCVNIACIFLAILNFKILYQTQKSSIVEFLMLDWEKKTTLLVALRRGISHPHEFFNLVTLHQINMVPCQNKFPHVRVNWTKQQCTETWCKCCDCTTALSHCQQYDGSNQMITGTWLVRTMKYWDKHTVYCTVYLLSSQVMYMVHIVPIFLNPCYLCKPSSLTI